MAEQTIAIVGASLGGLAAAETLRTEGFEGRVLLIGEEPHLPYDRPPLSKAVLTGEVPAESTLLAEASFYDDHRIELMLGQRVAALRPDAAEVELADGSTHHADQVLLVTGGRARRLLIPGADLAGVHVLRTLDDALAVAPGLQSGARVVVIGAGFIGAEVAASARHHGCEVTMIEAAALPLGRVLGPEICSRYADEHRAHGVRLLTSTAVERLEGHQRVERVVTADGAAYDADLVVVGVGIEPNTELAAEIGISVTNGIVVDEFGATSNPAVFAAGDVANLPVLGRPGRIRYEQWQHAREHAAAAARSMIGVGQPYTGTPWFWSDQYDLNLQMAGSPEPTDDIVWRGAVDDAAFAAFYLRDGRLTGVVAVNRPKDVRAAMGLLAGGVTLTVEQFADPSVDLRAAAKAARG